MTKRSHASSSSNPQGKQKVSVWEAKRKLVEQRLLDLENQTNNRKESVNMDTRIMRYEPKEENVTNDLHLSVDVSTSAMERAQDVQESLSPKFPSFIKRMLKSHVSGGFWLGLPHKFCVTNLPLFDETVVLVDENGEECSVKYLSGKTGLSGGWRGFSISHELLDGDVLVFQLIQPCKFKIYIVRATRLSNIDGATNLLTLNSRAEPNKPVEDLSEREAEITKIELVPAADQSENDDTSDTQVTNGIEFSESRLSFKDIKGIKDFKIQINGLIIDSEIPPHLRTKYYKLCCSQNMFLHDNLITGLNSKLVVGAIYETINIADAIRAAKPNSDLSEMEDWDRTLKAFEDLGMVVGFLRARIQKLLSVARESGGLIQLKRDERSEAEKEMRELKVKILDVEKRIKRFDKEIDALVKNKDMDGVFKEVVRAPW